jgi:NAD(P)-dependent dehydrogenase (short-subunit alcohol dehydrogenase family)
MELKGKVALVTGGARRVGRELSLALGRAGADLVVNYSRSAAQAQELCEQLEALGRRAVPVQADVSSGDDVARLIEVTTEVFGRLDVLVNNASMFENVPLLEITEESWDRVMAVNLKGPFLMSQAAEPLLRIHRRGLIVNMTDLAGIQTWPAYGHHGVSKAGVIHLTRVLARAFAPDIRVNAIAPGTVLPPEDYTPAQVESLRGRTPLQRIGTPADVVRAMMYLIEADYVTGQVVVVDGGRLLV